MQDLLNSEIWHYNTSDFVKQHKCVCSFTNGDSWVILSSLEQSIRNKIERVGTPLRDWNINIFRGVLTGYNDAFIIDTTKRDEILANCKTEEERKRTAELIRPILRGRDVKRYSYVWANLWLIATFPAKHYDIEKYPAVKEFLQSFGVERLEQTGKKHNVNGRTIKARKKTNNKWFETQDSISYWEDFYKPKILWKRVGSILRFSYDTTGCLGLDSTCFATGDGIAFLCCVLNSPMGHFLLKDAPKTGTGDLLISVQAVEPIRIPQEFDTRQYEDYLHRYLSGETDIEEKINNHIYDLYKLSPQEIDFIENREV